MGIPDKEKYTNRILHSDVEARGFLDVVHKAEHVWCICSRDDETDEVFLFHDYPEYDNQEVEDDGIFYTIPPRNGTLLEGVRFWYLAGQNGSKLSIHNLQTYDRILVEKIWEKCLIPESAWWDTFIQSKVQFFDRVQKKGSKSAHGLLNYSLMQGHKKPPVEDFTVMNAFMLHRCIIDTKTQKYCYQYLAKEAEKLAVLGIDFVEALKIENEYARGCAFQEINGVLVDVPHMKRCIEVWDKRTDELAAKIEPLLPPTVKVGSTRVTRSDMMKSLGFTRIPPDEVETVTRAGETKIQAVKPYFKPSVNFHKTIKTNAYSGFNISHGESPTYIKKRDLTTWIKEKHPDTKSKEWDIQKEEIETKELNAHTCKYFEVGPDDLETVCGAHTKVSFHESKLTQHSVVKGYLIRYAGLLSCEEWNFKRDSNNQIMRAESYMVVSYPPKAAPEHQLHYKIRAGEAIVTSPKVGTSEYDQITGEVGKDIGEHATTMHRRRYLSNPSDPENKGVMSYIREDGRVPAGIMNYNCATGRSTHRVIVNLPSESSHLGEEMRRILIAPEGRVLVGADQKSSQLQLASVVTNNTEYFNAVVKGKETVKDDNGVDVYLGTDAHTANALNFNLITRVQWQEAIDNQDSALIHELGLLRKLAKPAGFSVLFGAGGKKVALTLGISEAEGVEKRQSFLDQLGLTEVMAWLKVCSKKYKRGNGFYIPIAFGYWVYCSSVYKSGNYQIQGLESVVQKIAVNYFERELIARGLSDRAMKVLDQHDEMLIECDTELGLEVGLLMEEAYTHTGKSLHKWYNDNLDKYSGDRLDIVPDFNGSHAIGQSYFDCH